MRKQYVKALNSFFHEKLFQRREALGISQEEMVHRLAMANRTYVDLDHGKMGCSAPLFLIHICADPLDFLEELRHAFENSNWEAA